MHEEHHKILIKNNFGFWYVLSKLVCTENGSITYGTVFLTSLANWWIQRNWFPLFLRQLQVLEILYFFRSFYLEHVYLTKLKTFSTSLGWFGKYCWNFYRKIKDIFLRKYPWYKFGLSQKKMFISSFCLAQSFLVGVSIKVFLTLNFEQCL